MAGFCGCWQSQTAGHCNGCGYKTILRGALLSGSKVSTKETYPSTTQPSALAKPGNVKYLHEDDVRRRFSLPHSHEPGSPPPMQSQSLSLQRRSRGGSHLPMSSAYNIPMTRELKRGVRPQREPLSSSVRRATNAHDEPTITHSTQMMLSTIQPPPELCKAARSPINKTGQQVPPIEIPSSVSVPQPLKPIPPFEVASFIPQLSPRVFPVDVEAGSFLFSQIGDGLAFCPSSTSLHIRYQALSLARLSSRSYSDLLVDPCTQPYPVEPLSSRSSNMGSRPNSSVMGSRPSSFYSSYTLPTPPPPLPSHRICIRKPQEV